MTMPFLRAGLILGALGFLYVTWASARAGYPIEIAGVRGMLAFMALSFVAYIGELVVATSPPVAAAVDEDAQASTDEDDQDEKADETAQQRSDASRLAAIAPLESQLDNDEELQAA